MDSYSDKTLFALTKMAADRGISIKSMDACGLSGVIIIRDNVQAADLMAKGWTCLTQENGYYMLGKIVQGAWPTESKEVGS